MEDRELEVRTFIGVLRAHGAEVREIRENLLEVRAKGKKEMCLFEDGFINVEYVVRVARKFDIPSHLFFHSDFFN